jgi:hypothetical protein
MNKKCAHSLPSLVDNEIFTEDLDFETRRSEFLSPYPYCLLPFSPDGMFYDSPNPIFEVSTWDGRLITVVEPK